MFIAKKILGVNELKAENQKLSESYNRLCQEYDGLIEEWGDKISHLQEEIKNLQAEINDLEQESENLCNELEGALKTKQEKVRRINTLLNQKQNLQNKLFAAREKSSNLATDLENQSQDLAKEKNKTILLQKKARSLRTKLATEQNISQGLQDQINNHTCPVLTPHICSPCPLSHDPTVNCSHSDYQEIKQQRDTYQQQVQTIYQEKKNKEQQIIHQINQDCHLGLKEPNLEQVITRIQQLIQKPPQTIYEESSPVELEKELKDTPFGEDLAVIKQLELESLEQLFNQVVDSDIRQQITQATSYQQVVSARQAFLQKHLEKKQNIQPLSVTQPQNELIQPPNQERIILISCLVASLLTVGGLMVKMAKVRIKKPL